MLPSRNQIGWPVPCSIENSSLKGCVLYERLRGKEITRKKEIEIAEKREEKIAEKREEKTQQDLNETDIISLHFASERLI